MEIITLENASEIAFNELKKFIDENIIVFSKIEFTDGGSFQVKCSQRNVSKFKELDNITISFNIDYKRRNPTLPKNSTEYQLQGGHKTLIAKIESKNIEAWHCKIFAILENHQKMEIGNSLKESNFSISELQNIFKNHLL